MWPLSVFHWPLSVFLPQLRNAFGAYHYVGASAGEGVLPDELEHDYEEPYFEPATEEEGLLAQLKKLSIPVLEQETKVKWVPEFPQSSHLHRGAQACIGQFYQHDDSKAYSIMPAW